MKDPTDSRTYLTKANTLLQRVIDDGLRAKWPNVGVEDLGAAGPGGESVEGVESDLGVRVRVGEGGSKAGRSDKMKIGQCT